MATVATPLERHLGIIANVVGMNSESSVGINRGRSDPNSSRVCCSSGAG